MEPGVIIIKWDNLGRARIEAPVHHPLLFKILGQVIGDLEAARNPLVLAAPTQPSKIENRAN